MPCDFCSSANGKYFRVVFGGTVRNYCAQCAGQFQRGDALALQMAILNAPNQTNAGDVDKSCPECGMRFETMKKRMLIGDTDQGKEVRATINDLKLLIGAYQLGIIKEKNK